MMTNEQHRIAKYLYKSKTPKTLGNIYKKFKIDNDYISELFSGDDMDYLIYNANYEDNSQSLVSLSIRGIRAVESRLSASRRFSIPVIISIIALIGAYRSELACLLQVITKLLK